MRAAAIIASISIDRLHGVVRLWLWEFEEPENWPTLDSVRSVIAALQSRPDAVAGEVQTAIGECREYLSKFWPDSRPVPR